MYFYVFQDRSERSHILESMTRNMRRPFYGGGVMKMYALV